MYRTERLTAEISVEKYMEDFVDIEEFLEACKACGNYGRKWSCPPYDFNPEDYWRKFQTFKLIGIKIIFDEEYTSKTYGAEELNTLIEQVLSKEKDKLTKELYEMENKYPGSVSLSAGSCNMCGDSLSGSGKCSRALAENSTDGSSGGAEKHCRYYSKMRYSIESLGGNVGKTCSELFNIQLEWVTEGKLPSYFLLVSGLLTKKTEETNNGR